MKFTPSTREHTLRQVRELNAELGGQRADEDDDQYADRLIALARAKGFIPADEADRPRRKIGFC